MTGIKNFIETVDRLRGRPHAVRGHPVSTSTEVFGMDYLGVAFLLHAMVPRGLARISVPSLLFTMPSAIIGLCMALYHGTDEFITVGSGQIGAFLLTFTAFWIGYAYTTAADRYTDIMSTWSRVWGRFSILVAMSGDNDKLTDPLARFRAACHNVVIDALRTHRERSERVLALRGAATALVRVIAGIKMSDSVSDVVFEMVRDTVEDCIELASKRQSFMPPSIMVPAFSVIFFTYTVIMPATLFSTFGWYYLLVVFVTILLVFMVIDNCITVGDPFRNLDGVVAGMFNDLFDEYL